MHRGRTSVPIVQRLSLQRRCGGDVRVLLIRLTGLPQREHVTPRCRCRNHRVPVRRRWLVNMEETRCAIMVALADARWISHVEGLFTTRVNEVKLSP